MGWTEVFDEDEGGGTSTSLTIDGDRMLVKREQDVEPVIEVNKFLQSQYDAHAERKKDVRRVAQIPLVVLEDLRKRGILQDRAAFKKWLNDPDNRFFRTDHSRI